MRFLIEFSLGALGVIWIVYPAAIFILAWIKARPDPATSAGDDRVKVSVILATHADAARVATRVDNVLASSFAGEELEIVIGVDAAHGQALAAEIGRAVGPRAHVVEGDRPGGKAATLNAAVRASKGEILIFADTSQAFDRNAIQELVRALADSSTAAVSGMLEVPVRGDGPTLHDRYWHFERRLRRAEAAVHSSVGVTGAIYAMKRELWQDLPPGLILDDVYVPMRLALDGWHIGFTDKARATDAREFTAAEEHRRKVRTLTGVLQLCAWLPAVLLPFRNPLWVQFVFHKLLRLLTPYLIALLVVGLLRELIHSVATGAIDPSLLIGSAAVAALALAIRRVRQAVARQVTWAVALQASVVVATVNGFRGRWDVWHS